jgi:hypothetical protein
MHVVENMDHEYELDQDQIAKKEAHARAMLQKMNSNKEDMRLWRWALRGIVIQ